MLHGYGVVGKLCGELQDFMAHHGFESVEQFRGKALPFFTTHTDLVAKQKAALAARRAAKVGLSSDGEWSGDGFVAESAVRGIFFPFFSPPDNRGGMSL